MKKLILLMLVISAMILGGCNPCKRLALKCPTHDSTTVVERIIKDTVWVQSPADSMDLVIPVPTLLDLANLGIIVEDAKQKITVRVVHDTLRVQSTCKEDSLQVVIEHLETVISKKKTVYQEVEVEVEVIKNSKFAKFTMIAFFCCVFILIVYIYLKVKAGALKTALNRFQNLEK